MAHHSISPALTGLGWSEAWTEKRNVLPSTAGRPGRIAAEHKERYRLLDGEAEYQAVVSGRFRHEARLPTEFPVVGDWVLFEPPALPGPVIIQHVLPRRNAFTRQAAGGGSAGQVLASNLDTILIASSCNADWNLHRLDRCLALAHAGGIRPVVLLTKLDLADDPRPLVDACRNHLGTGVPVLAVSARTGEGLEELEPCLAPGLTLALIGSSGVGKSTLVNRLTQSPRMAVRDIRSDDDKGRHTTTHRQLVRLASGALLIDTPGIREVGMYDAAEGLSATFDDVAELARQCHFTDCRHEREPGCAVLAAVADNRIDPDRVEHYRKLLRENAYQAAREDVHLQQQRKQRNKAIHRHQKHIYKHFKPR